MKQFCLKCGWFFLPLMLIFLPTIYHLESYHELESVQAMVERNQNDGGLIGLAYTDPMHLVKQKVLEKRHPEIIALGTSRVLSFRDLYFIKPEAFYNCGRSVGKVQDLAQFLSSYPGKKPRVIILGLDQDFFGVEDGELIAPPRSYELKGTTYGTRLIKGTKAFFDAFKKAEVETGEVPSEASSFIGRNAWLYSEGYRRDGSYCYGRRLRAEKDDYSFHSTIRRIEKRKGRFAPVEAINLGAVEELERFLEICTANKIHVVAFLPPYASKVYQRLEEERDLFPHVFELHTLLQPFFDEHGFKVFDFSNLESVGSNDFETYDGFHASETAYLRIIRIMAEQDSVLSSMLDLSTVKKLFSNLHSARQFLEEIEEKNPQRPAR